MLHNYVHEIFRDGNANPSAPSVDRRMLIYAHNNLAVFAHSKRSDTE